MSRHWPSALERFEASTLVPELLGKEVHAAFAAIERSERPEFDAIANRLEYDT